MKRFVQNLVQPWHICDEVFYSEPFVTIPYLDFWDIQNLSKFRTEDIQNTLNP